MHLDNLPGTGAFSTSHCCAYKTFNVCGAYVKGFVVASSTLSGRHYHILHTTAHGKQANLPLVCVIVKWFGMKLISKSF